MPSLAPAAFPSSLSLFFKSIKKNVTLTIEHQSQRRNAMEVEVAPQRDAPPPRVPPLNLGAQATKRAPLDLLAYKTQKHWDDCIKRLHMIQDEERRRLLRHADNKIQAKRAEWLGGPVQTDASLTLSERRGGGWQTDRPGRTRSAHSIDTLVTPRGPSMDRLLQAARDPRGWMSTESASGSARGQALPASSARKSQRIAASASAPSDTDDEEEKSIGSLFGWLEVPCATLTLSVA